MMPTTVSIVIPVFNGERYLAAAIDSVLAQDNPEIELIVVDDGSEDGSAALAQAYGRRLTLIRQANAGQSAALATGWQAARGEIIGYLSADDLLCRSAVSTLLRALEDTPAAVLAYPDFRIIDAQGAVQREIAVPTFSRRRVYAELRCLPGPGALFRRSALQQAGPWRRDLRQIPDLDFYLRLGLAGDFIRVPQVLAEFRVHSGSTTYRPVPPARAEEPLRMLREFEARADLPEDVRRWTPQRRASAHYLTAILHAQSRRRRAAARHLLLALRHDPASLATPRAAGALRILLSPRLGLAPDI